MTTALLSGVAQADWKPAPDTMMTRWATDVSVDNVHPDYPRPQLVRSEWQALNGLWDYAIRPDSKQAGPDAWDGEILVPFCLESALSGVKKALAPDQTLWYRRSFTVPEKWAGQRLLLHFGAVDWRATIWMNGQKLGGHQGGYDPFSFDVTDALKDSGSQELVIAVQDPTNQGWQPRGKQALEPHGIWYTAVSGIWQTVWLEPVPHRYVRALKITPELDKKAVHVTVDASEPGKVYVAVRDGARTVTESMGKAGSTVTLTLPDVKPWSPDSPHLYDLEVGLAGEDRVTSYFGMRKVEIRKDGSDVNRIFLNGEPLFQYGPLDQGWWPDGLYTAPTDEALRYDLEVLKELGMNMLRKHVKVEPARYYYHCDQLGLLVWQDMPNGDGHIGGKDPDLTRSPESEAGFRKEWQAIMEAVANHPSIVVWVPFNEGWGQFKTTEILEWTQALDPTRLVDGPSGWTDRGSGDLYDKHMYPGPGMFPVEAGRASVLGEFGGLGWPVEGHLWWNKRNWGYRTYQSREELNRQYLDVVAKVRPLIENGLAAAIYTQTTDVEGEVNGLMTYDRDVLKLDADTVVPLHQSLYEPVPIIRDIQEVLPTSLRSGQTWRYQLTEPAAGWVQPAFDDTAWPAGEGMFGTDGTPGVRVGTIWDTSDIWLRGAFELTEIPDALRLNLYHDEDAEIFINGVPAVEVQGHTSVHQPATVSSEALRGLQVGRNVIAVHCRQTTGGQGIDVGIEALTLGP